MFSIDVVLKVWSHSLFRSGEAKHVSGITYIFTTDLLNLFLSYSAFYIAGIMMYKFGLEFFNGSITTLATDRFKSAQTFTKRKNSFRNSPHYWPCLFIPLVGAAQGINQAAQCVGAILISPLIKKFPTRTILACSIFFFGLMTALLLIVDAATGGEIKPKGAKSPSYGHWNPNLVRPFVFFFLSLFITIPVSK